MKTNSKLVTEKTKVFISYNHKDIQLRNNLLSFFEKKPFVDVIEAKYDNVISDNPSDLYGTISKLLNKSHIAIAIITKNWLKSNNTRDEFTRAHERRKTLYCLFKNDDEIDEKDIPFFIKGDLRYEFDSNTFDQRAFEVCNSIMQFRNHWQLKALDKIRKIGDIVESEGKREYLRKYTTGYFEKRLERTVNEMESVIKDSFSLNVSYEQNFLETAKPYFESANRIFAVSLIGVSTFWTDTNTPNPIKKSYLKAQNGEGREIVRLFVFAEPREVNHYKNVLQANYNEYGRNKEKGGVLVCSYSKYEILMNKWFYGDNGQILSIKDQDFGILIYEQDHMDELLVHEAILSNGQMNIKHIDFSDPIYESRTQFISDLQKKEKELEELGIIRWEDKLYDDPNAFSNALTALFKQSTNVRDIIHSIYFKVPNSVEIKIEFEKILLDFQNILDTNKKYYKIINTYFRSKADLPWEVTDGRTGGKLRISKAYNYSFTIIFSNRAALLDYYSDEMHSKIRRKLYTLLNPEVSPLFEAVEKLLEKRDMMIKMFSDDDDVEILDAQITYKYKEIERLVIDQYAIRTDWVNSNTSDSIVQRRGYQFLDYNR
ncbi:toll/interleukin-1 receptor domain-containing protein [Fibrella sp. HMF5335]|uniref:Toll/interleukin-1 receptor domain-containing protein n=1 Tax=Fibrella rubiginis TaxID=2817060 RepID=A0A939K0H0_9BACT|nr:toll/interleukin-1 receptor domain-containing protein [Fibrella rubiginis]MBO0936082.1 toll/interleukin-1 receptor domain-containing protein [Fibrella rubiginis]